MSEPPPAIRRSAGDWLDDLCRACKSVRRHTVQAVDGQGQVVRVVCDYCGSHHNFRGGDRVHDASRTLRAGGGGPRGIPLPLVSERERSAPPMSFGQGGVDLELLLRRIIREEAGVTPVAPADKWRGGELLLKPGKPGLQEKALPIDALFHKVVMIRNRLRTLEQQVNASELPDDQKLKLQSYITGCYGSLTSFNVLFADDDDKFVGSSSDG